MERISRTEAKKRGFKALTHWYSGAPNDKEMMEAVIKDLKRSRIPYVLVQNPFTRSETAIWRKGMQVA